MENEQGLNPAGTVNSSANSHAGVGLAVASLVLGLVSLSLSFFVIGILFGLVGLIIGIVHLARRMPFYKTMAVWGIVLSLLGTLANLGFGILYGISIYKTASQIKEWQEVSYKEYIGAPVPDINLVDIDGKNITLSQLKGKHVILDFWATWCGPCKMEIPHLIKLAGEGKNNLVIIGISSERKEVLKDFAKENQMNYPVVSESNLPKPFDRIPSIPTTFFIDSNGIIQKVLVGYHDYETLKTNASAENYKTEQKYEFNEPLKTAK